jgi:hypothetical protein
LRFNSALPDDFDPRDDKWEKILKEKYLEYQKNIKEGKIKNQPILYSV